MTRADLLALTSDALAALTNRGLVKRATAMPVDVAVDEDGTLCGTFPDGIAAEIAPGATLAKAVCSCGAPGICRHLLALVLGYQRIAGTTSAGSTAAGTVAALDSRLPDSAEAAAEQELWTPGEFDDTVLTAHLGSRVLTRARRSHAAGYLARVTRGPVPAVELPTCTVRFLVPHEIAYATSDAANDEMVALAVWAFRAADLAHPHDTQATVSVGGGAQPAAGIQEALTFPDELLRTGIIHASSQFSAARARQAAVGAQWPLDILAELEDQLRSHRTRHADYQAPAAAALIAEMTARHRSVVAGNGMPAAVLGTDELPETPLRRVRLLGLGARVRMVRADPTAVSPTPARTGTGGTTAAPGAANQPSTAEYLAEVYLAHLDSGAVLVVEHRWAGAPPDSAAGSGGARPGNGSRRVAGTTLSLLAGGNVITESAVRRANRTLRISPGRVGRTTVTPATGDWEELPPSLQITDLAHFAAALAEWPPALLRPRVRAASVRAVRIARVGAVGYHSGAQQVSAEIQDSHGGTARVVAAYNPASPGGLEAIADALAANPTWIAGPIRRTAGELQLTPTAIAVAGGVVIPDLIAHTRPGELSIDSGADYGPLEEAVDQALTALADVVHRGLDRMPPSTIAGLESAADVLGSLGLAVSAAAIRRVLSDRTPRAWYDAEIRLLIAAEQL